MFTKVCLLLYPFSLQWSPYFRHTGGTTQKLDEPQPQPKMKVSQADVK